MAGDDGSSGYKLMGLGMELAAAVTGLALLGYWIDRHFGSAPWGLLIGAVIGVVGGTYNLIREALSASAADRRASRDAPPDHSGRSGPDGEGDGG
jgi:F0F1-type ATP synthase assembly protein I